VGARGDWNRAYYGKAVTPLEILAEQKVSNPQAADLLAAVIRMGGISPTVPAPSAKAE